MFAISPSVSYRYINQNLYTMNTTLLQAIRQIIGDDKKIISIYLLVGSERVSFATLNSIIAFEGMDKDYKAGMPVSEIAKKHKYSTKQVRRILGLE